MSFLGKLFGKKENPEPQPKLREGEIATPWGPFMYLGIKYNSFEYEGMVDWYDDADEQCDVSIETNAVGSDDMSEGFERFAQLMNNRAEMDYKVKMAALDKLADSEGMIMSESEHMLMSKTLFPEKMVIECISVMRDGCTHFTMWDTDIYDIYNITVIYTDKGTFEVEIDNLR
ncbi:MULTISPECIES: DUF2262 domain-containing protein [Ruminococcus]|jgi:hypothetical protein|uniref:DUF2262 domain-containing protein n=1 Tax=Ruminococcus albus (strain ATCC 27210 / DSM 20455 / JCM 14654 / NCDO 2250 / 7) TaxID=697329 RepID=E6UCW9_RUMA7|nr:MULTISPECIES: DUF2262 domain-containing protein [Ruminococcus]ADU20763.1 hypothetical protein Rumal_0206 [Ruminococcus albus 7 = DSM 20455]MCR5021885.1 DUF2262 domain-containing protein [Ruminococcus sp.]